MLHWWWCYYVCLFGLVPLWPWPVLGVSARQACHSHGQEPAQYLPQFSCQSLALAARESENTRQTDSWDTENWVRGEKASPDTFYNGLHFVNTTYRTAYCCFFPSWTLQLSFSIKWVKTILTDWPWTDFAINKKYSKIGKETNKKSISSFTSSSCQAQKTPDTGVGGVGQTTSPISGSSLSLDVWRGRWPCLSLTICVDWNVTFAWGGLMLTGDGNEMRDEWNMKCRWCAESWCNYLHSY